MAVEFSLLALMVVFSAFFSGLEIALFSLGRAHLHTLVEQGVKGAKTVQRLKSNPERLLVIILIGNNIANIGSASLATALAIRIFGDVGVGIATGFMTLLILIFGEITPKTIAVRWAERISLLFARPLQMFGTLVYPAAWLLERLSRGMGKAFSHKSANEIEHETIVTTLSRLGLEEGKIEEHEHRLVENAFRMDQTTAERIMTPRSKVVAVQAGTSLKQALDDLGEQPFSRFPIYEGEKEMVIGILHIRDLFQQYARGSRMELSVEAIATKPLFVAATMPASDLLLLFQRERSHIAIVLDEYGDTDGVVTLEDVLEELVGEIEDEVDSVSHDIIKKADGSYLVYASLTIDDINRSLEIDLPAEEHNTLNGLLVDHFQNIPKPKQQIEIDGYQFVIRSADARKIDLVEMTLPAEEAGIANDE